MGALEKRGDMKNFERLSKKIPSRFLKPGRKNGSKLQGKLCSDQGAHSFAAQCAEQGF